MSQDQLKGLVIVMKPTKELVQTKRIRVYQRETLVDKLKFLIPFTYEDLDLTKFTVMLQYIDVSGTVRGEVLTRDSEDYEDADGNKTHMIYVLPVDSQLTRQSGDIKLKLNLDYVDNEGQTEDPEEEPTQKHYVLNTDDTILPILPVADYYSIVPDESLSLINNKIAELNNKIEELNATSEAYLTSKADDIKLDVVDDSKAIYLTAEGQKIGEGIILNDLGDALADYTNDGLVNVVTGDDDNHNTTDPQNDPQNPSGDPVDPDPNTSTTDPNQGGTDPSGDPTDPSNP